MTPPPRGQPRFVAGDPLRGLAALFVAVYHAGTVALLYSGHLPDVIHGWPHVFGVIGAPIGAGAQGVQIFFVLSGYLISRPFLAAFAERRRLPRPLSYLRNRVLRLVPGFWVAVGVVALFAGISGLTAGGLLATLGFSQDWTTSPLDNYLGQAWTLVVESRFYLAVPVVAGALTLTAYIAGRPRTRSGRLICAAILAVAGAVACLALVPRGSPREVYASLAQAPSLLLGVALAAAELALPRDFRLGRALRRAGAGAVLLCVAAVIWLQYPRQKLTGLLPLDWRVATAAITALGAVTVVGVPVMLEAAGARCWRVLDNAPLRWLGSRSYGLYLYQLFVLSEIERLSPDPGRYRVSFAFVLVVGIPATLLAAELSWRLVERPALALKSRTRRAAAGRVVPKPPASEPTSAPAGPVH